MADISAGSRRPDIDHRSRRDTDRGGRSHADRRERSDTDRRGRSDADFPGRPDADRRGRSDADFPGRPDADRRGRSDADFPGRSDVDSRGRLDGLDSLSSNHDVRSHSQHDNFTSRPKIIHRGRINSYPKNYNQKNAFKAYNYGNKTIKKNWNNKSYLDQNKFDGKPSKYNIPSKKKFSQRNSSHGSNGNFKNSLCVVDRSISGWYLVLVTNAEEFDEVLKKIELQISPLMFYPYDKRFSENTLKFLIDNYKVAVALCNTSYKITLRDDRKLIIKVIPYSPKRRISSLIPVSSELREKIMEAVATRYNPRTKSLDLSKFHAYSIFTNNQLFVPLNRPAVLLATLNIAAQHTKHNLYHLNLARNNIYLGDGLVWIRRLFPELKVLVLADNKFTELNKLKSLFGYTIEVLTLSKNPVCETMDKNCYTRSVQKLFPMLIKLDELNLPSLTIVDSKLKMPINLGNSYPIQQFSSNLVQSNPVTTLVELFLAKYYEQYDNKVSRQMILEAYHDNATFSLSSCLLKSCMHGSLTNYIPESRNLLISDQNQNINCLIHKGKENIIKILEKLPKTKHDFGSFIIDVPFASSTIIQVVVNGVFAEEFNENHNHQVFRSFCRTFSLVPAKNSWMILSDMMFITLVSSELMEESTKRFYIFKPSMTNYPSNSNSFKTTMLVEDTLPDVLSTLCSKTAIPNCLSSENQQDSLSSKQFSPLSQIIDTQSTSTFQTSVFQHLQSSYQQRHCPGLPLTTPIVSMLSNSQPLTSLCPMSSTKLSFPVPNTKPIEPALSIASTKIHLDSSNNHNENSKNELLMIKRFSNESGMNDKWSKKCLVENNWDYGKATLCFSKLKSIIPSIAYKH